MYVFAFLVHDAPASTTIYSLADALDIAHNIVSGCGIQFTTNNFSRKHTLKELLVFLHHETAGLIENCNGFLSIILLPTHQ